MDKVKDILAVLGKHHFWLLCGVVAVAVLISWYSTTGTLATETESNRLKIEGEFTALSQITMDPEHPTDAFRSAVEEKETQLRQITLDAWTTFYAAQQEVFTWPDKLTEEFRDLRETDPITEQMRRDYQIYVRDQFPELFELVKVRRQVTPDGRIDTGTSFTRPGNRDESAHYVGIVDWDSSQQQQLVSHYTWRQVPTELQVRMAHEDITVYRALLMIIRETNNFVSATDNRNAAVRRINYLAIGKDFWAPQKSDASQTMLLPPAQEGESSRNASSGSRESSDGEQLDVDVLWMTDRYLDEQLKPVAGKVAMENPPFAEFKQMPVRMGLTVDQRRIPILLAACANSPLTVEVRQVRYNPGDAEANAILKKTSAVAYGLGAGTTSGSSGLQIPSGSTFSQRGSRADDDALPHDMEIEIRGIVYIYNPPDESKLGTGTATDASQRAAGGFPQPGGSGSAGFAGGHVR